MPRQHIILGRPVTLSAPPRRFRIVLGLGIIVVLIIVFVFSPSNLTHETTQVVREAPALQKIAETAQQAVESFPRPNLPKLYNPFSDAVHQPPEQANSTHGDTRWYSDLKWANPFSSTITLDENRAVLPPLPKRPNIFTYYATDSKKDSRITDAENKLILTWRRAWWAQGFNPVVLGRPEAKKHPMYDSLLRLSLPSAVSAEAERWLAWSVMEGGILANWLTLPMANHDDETLVFLRLGQFDRLTRYKDLAGGIFHGGKKSIEDAITQVLHAEALSDASSFTDLIAAKSLDILPSPDSLAFYDISTIGSNYKVVSNQLQSSQAAGLNLLQQLINAHLHVSWQNAFSSGIAVLQPYPDHTNVLVGIASRLAQNLIQCPESPMPRTCPPNRPNCRTCQNGGTQSIPLSKPTYFQNKTSMFTIGTVPHPYTFSTLHYAQETLNVSFVRRETPRDLWLAGVTSDLLGEKMSGPQRLVKFKEAVASSYGTSHSLWITAESWNQIEKEYIFGFALPPPDPNLADPSTVGSKQKTTKSELTRERLLLEVSTDILKAIAKEGEPHEQGWRSSKENKEKQEIVEMVEAWHLADTESWRFVRAFNKRRHVERLKWEEEEKKFAGAEQRDKDWGNWMKLRR